MKLNVQDAPHIRYHENTRNLMLDVILVLSVVYAMALYYYGMRVLCLAAVGIVTAVLSDIAGTLISFRKPNGRDLSPVVTGMIIPLLMPASIPYYVVATAVVVAIIVAKHPFGGVGHNVFNPAAVGFSFAAICFPAQIFHYPIPLGEALPMWGPVEEFVVGTSPAFTLQLGGIPTYELVDMALGNYPGPMGATNILVIAACLLYLVFRNTVRWEMPVAFFLTVSAYAWLFPRVDVTRGHSVALELMSGFVLLGGVFLLGDPVTTPKRDLSKIVFGVIAGIVVMLFRRYGNLEEDFTFALLLMNASVWAIDMLMERFYSLIRRRRFALLDDKKVQKKA